MTLVPSFHCPRFFSNSTRSKRFKTLRLAVMVLAPFKLRCCDIDCSRCLCENERVDYGASPIFQMEYIPRFTNQSRVPHGKLGLAMTVLFILGLDLIASSSVDWFLLKHSLRNRFANSDWITIRELSDWLGDKSRQPPVLVDVRTSAEWSVSHLPGA